LDADGGPSFSSSFFSQVQSWEQDPKLEKIAKLLWDERRLEAPTAEDHRAFRQQAEGILGPEENLFRIDWVSPPLLPFVVARGLSQHDD